MKYEDSYEDMAKDEIPSDTLQFGKINGGICYIS